MKEWMDLPVRVVEGYGVNHIPVALQGVQLLARCCVPDLACPIIASCDKANTGDMNTAVHDERHRHCAHR